MAKRSYADIHTVGDSYSSENNTRLSGGIERVKCPYLDTINRQVLDFDMEKQCCVTLSTQNVYCCLVCGKYFQGRGKNTPAYTHSVQCSHFVFLNVSDSAIYCLPDSYEVIDSSLEDIKKCLKPTFSEKDIVELNSSTSLAKDIHGINYLPGFVGLGNMNHTDFINVIVLALVHIVPLRDFFLVPSNYANSPSRLLQKFGELCRKIWSKDNFKSIISPHELLYEISVQSKKRFAIGKLSEASEFLVWLLDELHKGIVAGQLQIGTGNVSSASSSSSHGATKSKRARISGASSIIHQLFQGKMEVSTFTEKLVVPAAPTAPGIEGEDVDNDHLETTVVEPTNATPTPTRTIEQKSQEIPFVILSLNIPASPLFKDSEGGLVIPQLPLYDVLKRYSGEQCFDIGVPGVSKTYTIRELPRYLFIHLKRFTKNNFSQEKNSTIVTFPMKNLELRDYYFPNDSTAARALAVPSSEEIGQMSILELKSYISKSSSDQAKQMSVIIDKEELVCLARAISDQQRRIFGTKYDLICNICHDSVIGQGLQVGEQKNMHTTQSKPAVATEGIIPGKFRTHCLNRTTNQWYEIQDLYVTEMSPQIIGLSESYLLVYEKK